MGAIQLGAPEAQALPGGGQLACAAADCLALRDGDGLVQEVQMRRTIPGGAMRGGGVRMASPRVSSPRGGFRAGVSPRLRSDMPRRFGNRSARRIIADARPRDRYDRYHRYDRRDRKHRRHHRKHRSFVFVGIPYYYGFPYYYDYYDPYYYAAAEVEVWSDEWIAACMRKYRSFNPRTGMYRTYSGELRFCRIEPEDLVY
jgi:hypothetical protein